LSALHNEYVPGSAPLEIMFFWKKESAPEEVEESFFKTVEYYNIFSSRLIRIDENKFALQYCTDGVIFNYLSLADAAFDNTSIDDIKKMMVHVKTLPGEPLLAVTVISIAGGKFVGISCSDAVADFFSLILFCFAWKCIIEGHDFPRPSSQRLFKGRPVNSDEIDKKFVPPLSELNGEIQNRVILNNVQTYTKKEFFSDEFLHEIKNDARRENEKFVISDNQIINAFLLKKYHDIILPNTNKIVLRNPVNLREIHPDLDPLYLGNAFFDNTSKFTKDEIHEMSILQIAYRLKESVTNTRNRNYISKISYLSEYGVEFKFDMIKNHSFYNVVTDIVSSNLIHLNDPESLGLSSKLVSVLYIKAAPSSFIILKEKNGDMYAEITSSYPFITH
jgi:hypothetical protein